jgi:hypothetical protein
MQILNYTIKNYYVLDSLPGETFKTIIYIKSSIFEYEINISNMDVHPKIKQCINSRNVNYTKG